MSSTQPGAPKNSQKTNAAEDGDKFAPRESEDMEAESQSAVTPLDAKQVNDTTQNETLDQQIDGDEGKNTMPIQTSFARADIISVYVGKERAEFGIHKNILTGKSPFFEKCLAAGMKETMESAVSLPEDDPEDFNIVVEWMYGTNVKNVHKPEEFVTAYNLADKLCMPQLQNAIADHLRLRTPLPKPANAS